MLEKTLEGPLHSKEIKPVNPKGNQSWIIIGRTDAEAPILWPPRCQELSHWKTLMLGKTESKRRGRHWIRLLDSITDSVDMNLSKLSEILKNRGA